MCVCVCVYSSGAATFFFSIFFFFRLCYQGAPRSESALRVRANSTYFFLFFFPFSGAGIEALTAAIQLCESAPNSSKAVKRSAECHELLAICFQQVLGLLALLVA